MSRPAPCGIEANLDLKAPFRSSLWLGRAWVSWIANSHFTHFAAEIVYTPQTTYVLPGVRDTISLPASLQVKPEPVTASTMQLPASTAGLGPSTSVTSGPMSQRLRIAMSVVQQQQQQQKQHQHHHQQQQQQQLQQQQALQQQQLEQQQALGGLLPADPNERNRLVKKQERMIKNRQAASLSRQRKKEVGRKMLLSG